MSDTQKLTKELSLLDRYLTIWIFPESVARLEAVECCATAVPGASAPAQEEKS